MRVQKQASYQTSITTFLKQISILLLLLIFTTSCSSLLDTNTDNEDCTDPDYSSCNTDEPDEGYLEISYSNNTAADSVLIKVFFGDFEDQDLLFSGYDSSGFLEISAPLNKDYSATALYYIDGKEITAVDGDYFKKQGVAYCDSVCWSITGGYLDLKLKD